jgi:hypothetical protein
MMDPQPPAQTETEGACIICYEARPPPIQSGCGCRHDGGLAHVGCLAQAAASQAAHQGNIAWRQCQTCKQDFTEAMRTGLAEERWSRVRDQAEESADRLDAANNLAGSLLARGRYAEAERMQRELHGVQMRVLGAEHPDTDDGEQFGYVPRRPREVCRRRANRA